MLWERSVVKGSAVIRDVLREGAVRVSVVTGGVVWGFVRGAL